MPLNPASMDSPVQRHFFRPDIQGVRAVAVVMVLLFHVWPGALSGGYVGVDVFFVISGFLITGVLLRQVEATGRIGIADFYARRIRRLLPAATLVLIAVGTCVSLLPVARWGDIAHEVVASSLYFENWWLAGNSVDYHASEMAASPLRHYWSLSVEEQYYLAWPLIFAAVMWLPSARRHPVRAFMIVLVVIAAGSLAYSTWLTPRNSGFAYFSTFTRAWELALGGALCAFGSVARLPKGMRAALGYIGLALVVAAAWWFDADTPFPGYHAMLPAVGAALLIAADDAGGALSINRLLSSAPFQYFGDISYSLYLWHWPVIVFYIEIAGRQPQLIDGLVIIVVSVALAHQTKALVEDPFRAKGAFDKSAWMSFVLAAACIASSLCSAYLVNRQFRIRSDAGTDIASSPLYPGALALTEGVSVPSAEIRPSVLAASQDRGQAYDDGCIANTNDPTVKMCTYGAPEGKLHVVLLGDSHAAHWLPAYEVIAEKNQWRLTIVSKSACLAADIAIRQGKDEVYTTCLEWNQSLPGVLAELRPDFIIISQSRTYLRLLAEGRDLPEDKRLGLVTDAIGRSWDDYRKSGAKLIAMADTPWMKVNVPDCMSSQKGTAEDCSTSRRSAIGRPDPVAITASRTRVPLIDVTHAICATETCEPVVGNVLVWRDSHHLTAEYARSLVPELTQQLQPIIGKSSFRTE